MRNKVLVEEHACFVQYIAEQQKKNDTSQTYREKMMLLMQELE